MSTTSSTDLQPHLSSVSRSPAISLSSQVMVAAIIFFFAVVVFVLLLHVYARMRWGRMAASASRRSRLVFAADQDPPAAPHRGLDRSAIEALPVSVYCAEAGGGAGGLECAVCLSELSEGEKVRILPKCNHGFHLDCIDMWFHSHSTCPLCRRPVGPSGDLEAGGGAEATPPQEQPDLAADSTAPNLPTNVLFWGTHDQVRTVAQEAGAAAAASSSSSPAGKPDGALVIQMPRQATEFSFSSPLSPLPSSKFPGDQELKSPAATAVPTPTRLRSFRRILSREKRVVGPSCSPRGGVVGDVEQGLGGTDGGGCRGAVPRTPGPNP